MLFVNNNGKIVPRDMASIDAGSRGFLYGDGVFESIRIFHGAMINFEVHVQRLFQGAAALQIILPANLTSEFLAAQCTELIEQSGIKSGGKCRLSLDRVAGGAYLPENNNGVYFIEVLPHVDNDFQLNYKGLEIDIYRDIKLQKTFLSPFKTKNGLTKVMASLKAKELGFDDLILQNDKGDLLESANSNLFIVSNGVLYTPGLNDGCIAGTMRMMVINLAIQNNIRVYECPILPHNLLSADEVFLTNAISGIRWVGGYRTKRYQNTIARRLILLLNAFWMKELGQ
jgi:branched-subunit amino acid aminotransferase/4-amino-4-deoxychorismate lyase